jgi:hypothetical protein
MAFTAKYLTDDVAQPSSYGAAGKRSLFLYGSRLFQVGYNGIAGEISVLSSNDDGLTWTVEDEGNAPDAGNAFEVYGVADGASLHVIYEFVETISGSRTSEIRRKTFDMSTRLWTGAISQSGYGFGGGTVAHSTLLLGVTPLQTGADYAVIYLTSNPATSDKELYYGRYTGGAWAAAVILDTPSSGSSDQFGSLGEIAYDTASSVLHMFWSRRTGASTVGFYHRAANASYTLDTVQTIFSDEYTGFANSFWILNAVIFGSNIYVSFNERYDAGNVNRARPAVAYGTASQTSPTWNTETVASDQTLTQRGPTLTVIGSALIAVFAPDSSTGGDTYSILYRTNTGSGWGSSSTTLIDLRDDTTPPFANQNIEMPPSIDTPANPYYITDLYQFSPIVLGNSVGFALTFQVDFSQIASPFDFASVGYFLYEQLCCCSDFAY